MPGSVDVAVIGAGLAGLVAARDVAAAGLGVTVLEARDRVGGRLLNAALPGADGEIVEAGGQWVGPGQDLDRAARRVPLDAPWSGPGAAGWTARRSPPGCGAGWAPCAGWRSPAW